MTITQLLKKLQRRNEREGNDVFRQELFPPEPMMAGISVLAPGMFREPSPMLRARFEYAARWTDAWAGQTWLGIEDMKGTWTDRGLQK